MSDHASYLTLCDFYNWCPDCHEDLVGCRCADDQAREVLFTLHPAGCLCCQDDYTEYREAHLDADHDHAPVRVVWPAPHRSIGRGPWVAMVEHPTLIGTGAL